MTNQNSNIQVENSESILGKKKSEEVIELTNIEYMFELSETLFGCWGSTEALLCERNPLVGLEARLLDQFKGEDVIDSVNDEIRELAATFVEYFDVLYPMANELQKKARRLAELTGQKIRNDWLPE